MKARTILGLATIALLTLPGTRANGSPPPVPRWIDYFGACVSVCQTDEGYCPCLDFGYKLV